MDQPLAAPTARRRTTSASSHRPGSQAALLDVDLQHVGDELRRALGQRDPALNLGAKKGNFAHDTGEGSMSKYHREHGGDIIWEIGFGLLRLPQRRRQLQRRQVRETGRRAAGEDDRDQAEPGRQARPRRRAAGRQGHAGDRRRARRADGPSIASRRPPFRVFDARRDAEFIAELRELSGGKPTGFKLCIGHPWEFFGIAKAMLETGICRTSSSSTGGRRHRRGAAGIHRPRRRAAAGRPAVRAQHAGRHRPARDRIKIGAAGKIVTAFDIARMMAIGADWCNSARGFMFALGCIQSQSCHTDRCPTGVATQDPVRQRALVVPDKSERVFNFHHNTLAIISICGRGGEAAVRHAFAQRA
jgi:hypothetical protein